MLSFVLPGLGQIFKRKLYRAFAIQGTIGGLMIPAWMFLIAGLFGGVKHIGDGSYALAVLLMAAVPLIGAAMIWGWQVYDNATA